MKHTKVSPTEKKKFQPSGKKKKDFHLTCTKKYLASLKIPNPPSVMVHP